MMKKIIPIILVVLILAQTTALATDKSELPSIIEKHMTGLIDMDRVFKYDYMEFETVEEEIPQEVFKYHNAVNAVLTLGLMEKLPDGTFAEDDAVPFKTFANIIMQLTTGYSEELEEAYKLYSDTRYTNFDEAAYYLVGAAGYGVYEGRQKGDNPRSQIARQIGLTKGVSFVGERNITRGELAQMILNTLQIDMIEQTTYGDNETFEKNEGRNLIGEMFDAALVYGTVTAQNGINLYVENPLDKDTISIDRIVYDLDGYKVGDVLGHQVQAIVRNEKNRTGTILGITIDESDNTLSVPVDNRTYTDGRYVYYRDAESNKEKKQSLSHVQNVILNDELITKDQLIDVLNTVEGEIRFVCTEQGGSYTMALVRAWSTYVVKSASTMDEKIYLNYGATFKSQSYIDVDSSKYVTIEKDGQLIELKNVAAGSVIDVIENQAGDAVTIVVTDKKITGSVTELEGDIVYIDAKPYAVSYAFEDALRSNPTMTDITAGVSGEFKLNKGGKIVSFSPLDDGYTLGLMKEFGRTDRGMSSKTLIKVFTEDNEWRELELAEKLVMDGNSGVSAANAYIAMEASRENVCYAPVRFALNAAGEVRFLDTAIVNDSERSDSNSIIKAVPWSGKVNYTTTAKATWSSFTDSKYSFRNDTLWMVIPTDPEQEKDYSINTQHYLNWNQYIVTDLYNADDFWSVDIVVKHGTSSGGVLFENSRMRMIFLYYANAIDDEGEEIFEVHAYAGNTGAYDLMTFTVDDPAIKEQVKSFSPGDIIHYTNDATKILRMELWCPVEDIGTDHSDDSATLVQDMLGTVIDVDAERNLVKVNVNDVIFALKMNSNFLYETEEQKGMTITADDVQPGDRIFFVGDYNQGGCLIIR